MNTGFPRKKPKDQYHQVQARVQQIITIAFNVDAIAGIVDDQSPELCIY